ncbi:MAG: hypothetical protein HUU55_05465 [Myxococcales bacterium]|nr:hypothetical protein [Myxococcales bacterium]
MYFEATERSSQLSFLTPARAEKDQIIGAVSANRVLDAASAAHIRGYWEKVARYTEDVETMAVTEMLLRELEKDVDCIKNVAAHLGLQGQVQGMDAAMDLAQTLLRMLDQVRKKLKAKHQDLADDALFRFLAWNPATPKTPPRAIKDRENEKKLNRTRQTQAIIQEAAKSTAPRQQGPQKQREEKPDKEFKQ